MNSAPVVMVVDDDQVLRALVSERLDLLGYLTVVAGNGPEALQILQSGRVVDAAIVDVQMPGGMDGFALAQWMAKHVPEVHVMLTSGNPGARKTMRRLMPSIPFVAKPFSMTRIVEELNEVLDKDQVRH